MRTYLEHNWWNSWCRLWGVIGQTMAFEQNLALATMFPTYDFGERAREALAEQFGALLLVALRTLAGEYK